MKKTIHLTMALFLAACNTLKKTETTQSSQQSTATTAATSQSVQTQQSASNATITEFGTEPVNVPGATAQINATAQQLAGGDTLIEQSNGLIVYLSRNSGTGAISAKAVQKPQTIPAGVKKTTVINTAGQSTLTGQATQGSTTTAKASATSKISEKISGGFFAFAFIAIVIGLEVLILIIIFLSGHGKI